jgi:very-short-patch-repair endonuclease
MSADGEVLVAIMNNPLDFAIAQDRHWYRVPVSSAEKWLKVRWPPQWLAFYQTKIFGEEAYAINYWAEVLGLRQVARWQLFPDQPRDERNNRRYWQISLGPLQRLSTPIFSRRWRRIVFIPTTWQKFDSAVEINDFYDESPLEDLLWAEFKRWKIQAERQEFVKVVDSDYVLDFAIYCGTGKVDVEADGDTWHANPEKAVQDNRRDNALNAVGWKVLRFTSYQIREEVSDYCLRTVVDTVNNLGGVDEGQLLPRRIDPGGPGSAHQLGLFDNL